MEQNYSIDVILLVWNCQVICSFDVSERSNEKKKKYFVCFFYDYYLVEDVFNDLTENELKEQVNKISLAFEQQEKIKDDVMKLFDTETLTL